MLILKQSNRKNTEALMMDTSKPDQVNVGDFVILRGPFDVDGFFVVGYKDQEKTKLWNVYPNHQKPSFDPMNRWHVSNVIIDIHTDDINASTIIDVVRGVSSVENCTLAPSTRLSSSKSIQKLTGQINAVQFIFNLVHHDFNLPEKVFGCIPDDQQKEFMDKFSKSNEKYRIAEDIIDIKEQIKNGKISTVDENFPSLISQRLKLIIHTENQNIMPQDDIEDDNLDLNSNHTHHAT